MFTNDIDDNVETLKVLLAGLQPEHRRRAQRAAVKIENIWNALIKDNPKDKAVALGAAFAVFMLAQRLGEAPEQGGNGSDTKLIQLLS